MLSGAQAPPSTPPPAPPSASSPDSPQPSTTSAPEPSSSSVPVNSRRSTAPKYPRIEWSGGYSYGQTGFFNAGHWAGLNGWNASFGLNAATWLGFVVEVREFFGTSKIPRNVPAPFPTCGRFCPLTDPFDVKTREYDVLFGAQFPYRKYERWTPFGELMFGHGGVRGKATAQGDTEVEVSSGMALLTGGGADYNINRRFAVRFKADYLQTRVFTQKQDNLRFSVGIVIRSVHKAKPRLED